MQTQLNTYIYTCSDIQIVIFNWPTVEITCPMLNCAPLMKYTCQISIEIAWPIIVKVHTQFMYKLHALL
jgi:hypothetical protein